MGQWTANYSKLLLPLGEFYVSCTFYVYPKGNGGLLNGPSINPAEHSESKALSNTEGCRKTDERLLQQCESCGPE